MFNSAITHQEMTYMWRVHDRPSERDGQAAQNVMVDVFEGFCNLQYLFARNAIDVFVGWNQTCQKILYVQASLFRAKIDF